MYHMRLQGDLKTHVKKDFPLRNTLIIFSLPGNVFTIIWDNIRIDVNAIEN